MDRAPIKGICRSSTSGSRDGVNPHRRPAGDADRVEDGAQAFTREMARRGEEQSGGATRERCNTGHQHHQTHRMGEGWGVSADGATETWP